jgi:hypothetical protein
MRPNVKKLIFFAPLAILGILLFTFLGGELVMHLWNWLLPPLFGFRQITFWHALGLLLLSRILFGGFGLRGPQGPRPHFRSRMADRLADRIGDRWDAMTPEDRERFRQRMRERFGFEPSAGASHEQ